jgi:hypothetical protein
MLFSSGSDNYFMKDRNFQNDFVWIFRNKSDVFLLGIIAVFHYIA